MCLIFQAQPALGERKVLLDPSAAPGGMGRQAPGEPMPTPDRPVHLEKLVRPEPRVGLGSPDPLGRPALKEMLDLRCLVSWPLFWPQLP